MADANRELENFRLAESGFQSLIEACDDPADPRRTHGQVMLGEMLAELSRYDEEVSHILREERGGDHRYTLEALGQLQAAQGKL